MIISADNIKNYTEMLLDVCGDDPFACRIISLYNSYNPELAFVDYWMIIDDVSKNCVGAIARSGTAFIIYLTREEDIDEVSSFMRVAGASSAICSGDFNLNVFDGKSVTGAVLVKDDSFKLIDNKLRIYTPDIKAVYELIVKCADENFKPPQFEDFYVDVNHKLRHGTMRICGISEDNRLAAVAMTVAESRNAAILGAVSCDPEYRKHGYGSSIVKYITNELLSENKKVYLHRAKNANVSFYNNLEFKDYGIWREYYFGR